MSTKEMQERLVENMKKLQAIEDMSVVSTGRIIGETQNPLIRLIMEIIQRDSHMHRRVQEFIAGTLEQQAVSLTPEELGSVWEGIERHIDIERRMVQYLDESLEDLKGKRMLVQEYLLKYLREDERKHNDLLSALEQIKRDAYPYVS
jgi:hypothetical protein